MCTLLYSVRHTPPWPLQVPDPVEQDPVPSLHIDLTSEVLQLLVVIPLNVQLPPELLLFPLPELPFLVGLFVPRYCCFDFDWRFRRRAGFPQWHLHWGCLSFRNLQENYRYLLVESASTIALHGANLLELPTSWVAACRAALGGDPLGGGGGKCRPKRRRRDNRCSTPSVGSAHSSRHHIGQR